MKRLRTVRYAAVVLALVATACGGTGEGDTKTLGGGTFEPSTTTVASAESAATTAKTPATVPPETATTTTAAPTTTTTRAPQRGTIADPLPMGEASVSGFVYTDWLGGEWEGSLEGVVEVDRGVYNEDPGRCFVLVGTLVPTLIVDGTVSSPFSAPDFSVIANGRLIDSDSLECDTDGVEAAGYGWILDAEVTAGTTYPFYIEFFMPGEDPADMDVIVLGDAGGDDALYYRPDYLDSIPTPSSPGGAADEFPDALPMGASAGFTYTSWLGDEWEGFVTAMVEVDRSPYTDELGHCLVLVGSLTPTAIEDGVVSDPFATPDFAVIAGGRLVDSDSFSCDTDEVEAAGYGWILDAEVTQGTEYPFYTAIFMAGEEPPDIAVVVVGDAGSDDALYFEPTYLDAIPTP